MDVIGKTKIYRKDFDGRPAYSRAIASRKYENGQKGDWVKTYEPVQFPKDTHILDGTMVMIKGFESVYETKTGEVKRKLVVKEFSIVPSEEESAEHGFSKLSNDDIPF